MRIRTIKPDFFQHDGIAELPSIARLLFIGLWCMADRRGRLEDRPRRIKVALLPYDDYDVDDLLQILHTAGFILRYKVDDQKLIQIPAFERHQRITGKECERESCFPGPNGKFIKETPEKPDANGVETPGKFGKTTGETETDSANSTGETTGKQRGNNGETPGTTEGRKEGRK